MEQARRNVLRRKQLAATETSIRFRKIDTLTTRHAAEENACARKSLSRIPADAVKGVPLVIEAPSTSSPSSPCSSSLSISHHSISLTLQAWREWREKNRSVITHLKAQETKRRNRERAERRLSPHWTKAKEINRAPAYMSVILESGMATSFTLNFSPDVLRAAEKAKEGAFHNLRSRITRELKKALGDSPRLVCGLDRTASGRLHIHGALVLDPSQRLAAIAALRRAGGKWAKGTGQRHQLHMQADQWSLMGEEFSDVQRPLNADWAGYCTKIAKRLRNETNHSVLYASPEIKRCAQEIYNNNRSQHRPMKDSNRSINIDLQPEITSIDPIVSESEIDLYRPVINTKRGTDLENADRIAGILRRPLSGHARHRRAARQAQHRHGRAPAPWASQLHGSRSHHRRWGADPPRSRRALHPAQKRTDARRAGRLGSSSCGLSDLNSQATGPPSQNPNSWDFVHCTTSAYRILELPA